MRSALAKSKQPLPRKKLLVGQTAAAAPLAAQAGLSQVRLLREDDGQGKGLALYQLLLD